MKHWYYVYTSVKGDFTYTQADSLLEADKAFELETGSDPAKTKGVSVHMVCPDCLQQPPACNGTLCLPVY
jgi:hypothetical protein